MISSKVTPVEECPMCGEENIRLINICPINNSEHKICQQCIIKLRNKYNKEFCAYCGERPVIINTPITVTSESNTVNIVIENRRDSQREVLRKKHSCLFYIFGIIVCYIGLIFNWHLYRMINHYIEEGETLNKEIDWHIYNAFYALFIDICLVFFIVHICENKCNN